MANANEPSTPPGVIRRQRVDSYDTQGDDTPTNPLVGPMLTDLYQLTMVYAYWREGRRMVGQSTVIEQHLLPQDSQRMVAMAPVDDSGTLQTIAIGNYANDHHYPGEDWPLAPKSCRWGGRWRCRGCI